MVMTRPLRTDTPDADLQFETGRFVPISFFAWDGSNSETGTSHSMTTWYWLLLQPEANSKPVIYGVLAGLLVLIVLLWWGNKGASRAPRVANGS